MALVEANERINKLEVAIQRVDSVKRHLNRHASDIKAEIHSSISRNLECLRQREVELLGEVDKALAVKEDGLQLQQSRLNKALGILQTGVALLQNDSASEKQLRDTLFKLRGLELSPEETPYIAFKADNVGIHDSILSYGRVDANGLPLASAFEDPQKPSASLPRHVEEYEDADHHIFYKTIEELKREKSSGKIMVSIPKLSSRMEDWLQKKSNLSSATNADRPSSLSNPLSQKDNGSATPTLGVSNSSTPGEAGSLNNWLSIIKQHADQEEEHDYEIIDNTTPFKHIKNKINEEPFKHINKDLHIWLSKTSTWQRKPEKLDFFKHIPTDTQVWLLQVCRQITSLEEMKHKDLFQHISREPTNWLRSKATKQQTACESVAPCLDKNLMDKNNVFKNFTFNNSLDDWLYKAVSDKKATNKSCFLIQNNKNDYTQWLQKQTPKEKFQLEDICRANELCSSLDECVSKPNCQKMCKQMEKADKKDQESTEKESIKPFELPLSEWLLHNPENTQADWLFKSKPEAKEGFFKHIAGRDDAMWLRYVPGESSDETNSVTDSGPKSFGEKQDEEKVSEDVLKSWKEKSESGGNCNNSSSSSVSDWLLVSKPDKQPELEKEEMSEGWSLCSSPYSFSSDQHVKDVDVANEYFNKWLL